MCIKNVTMETPQNINDNERKYNINKHICNIIKYIFNLIIFIWVDELLTNNELFIDDYFFKNQFITGLDLIVYIIYMYLIVYNIVKLCSYILKIKYVIMYIFFNIFSIVTLKLYNTETSKIISIMNKINMIVVFYYLNKWLQSINYYESMMNILNFLKYD